MKNRKKLLLGIVLLLLIAVAIGGRLYARQAAKGFGLQLGQAFALVSREGFANTAALRGLFADPDMAGYATRARQLSFLGGDYDERINALQTGMIYFSEQMSLSPDQRFASPPQLKHLTIEAGDHSDSGVAAAATKLILTYGSQL